MGKVEKELEDVIKKEIEQLESFEPGSPEKTNAVNDLKKLYELKQTDDKIRMELTNSALNERARKEQIDENRTDRIVKVVVAGVELGVPLVFYWIWLRMGFKFEEKGFISSNTFRQFISNIKPFKPKR